MTVALMYMDDDGLLQTTEKSHGGNTALGGLDIDDALLQARSEQVRPQGRVAGIRTAGPRLRMLSWRRRRLLLSPAPSGPP